MVADEAEAMFICDYSGCSRSYLRKEHLKRHTLTHQKGRFLCHLCQRSFTRNDLLHAHLQRHQGTFPPRRNPNVQHEKLTRPKASSKHGGLERDTWATETGGSPNGHSHSTLSDMERTIPQADCISNELLTSGAYESSEFTTEPWLFGGMGLFSYQPEVSMLFDGTSDVNLDMEELRSEPDPTRDWTGIVACTKLSFSHSDAQRIWNLNITPDRGPLDDIASISTAFRSFLDYCDLFMPIFHRPSFVISETPALLLLTMCHAGIQIRATPQHGNWSRALHQELSQMAMKAALSSPKVELWLLQTLVVIQHVGMYCLSGLEHEMAIIMHNLIVTMARQNNHMGESHSTPGGRNAAQSHVRWQEWVQREATVRLAHVIFISDVQYLIHFSHHMNLSVTMMKRSLPCSTSLWQAPTAEDWEVQINADKHVRQHNRHGLHSLVEHLLTARESEFKRDNWYRFEAVNALSSYISIHGLIAAIAEDKYRVVESTASSATRTLKKVDFSNGLRLWRHGFECIPASQRNSPLVHSAKIMYHFAAVLITNTISDPQMAAGTAFTFGRVVTAQRSQEAYSRLISTNRLCRDSYLHGLAIVQLGLQSHEEPCEDDVNNMEAEDGNSTTTISVPVWQAYSAFLGVLIVWARVIGLESTPPSGVNEEVGSFCCDMLFGGTDSSREDSRTTWRGMGRFPSSQMPIAILKRELSEDDNDLALDAAKGNFHILSGLVQNCLRGNSWYVAFEATRILQALSRTRRYIADEA